MIDYDVVLDTTGLVCPMPVLKTKKALLTMDIGQVVKVICTDPSSVIDFESLVVVTGHTMLVREHQDEQFVFVIRKEESSQ